jgi:hypothetical protein
MSTNNKRVAYLTAFSLLCSNRGYCNKWIWNAVLQQLCVQTSLTLSVFNTKMFNRLVLYDKSAKVVFAKSWPKLLSLGHCTV